MSTNKDTVQRYMDAYSRWDHAEVLACLTDDIQWVVPGAFHLKGREAFDNEIEGTGAAGPPEIVVTRLVEEADVVVAEGRVRNALKDGGVLSLVFCDVFLMRDGLIRHLTSYLMPVPDSQLTYRGLPASAS
jgi:ketosteroid isomerase-like protein